MKQELMISIGPDGNVNIEVKGIPGGDCLDITKEIEEELGVVTNRDYTSEYYQQKATTQNTVKLSND